MSKKYFPAIIIQKTATETEAIVGLEMKSLLKGDLYYDEINASNANEQWMVTCRERFLQALSAWPENVTLELLITSLPNLQFRAKGRVLITILIRVRAYNDIRARQEVIAKYLAMRALLNSNMNEAEFAPIMNEDELNFHLYPFKPTNALCVQRRSENIQLSEPIERKTITGLSLRNQPERMEANGSFVILIYPWRESLDDWSRLIHFLMGQLDSLQLIIRLQSSKLTAAKRKKIEGNIRLCELYLNQGKSYQLSLMHQAKMVRNTLSHQLTSLSCNAFNIGVFILAGHDIDHSLGYMLGQSITTTLMRGDDSFLYGGFTVTPVNLKKVKNSKFFPDKMPLSLSEAACAFRLPSPPAKDILGLPIRRSRTNLSRLPNLNHLETDSIDLCRNIHNGFTQPVNIPADDRMRHMFIIGQTGTGKSTMMESMILQDIRAGHGLAVIDPHGETVDNVLGKIPESRLDDVILFDVLDRERPLGFNLLQWRTLEERDFIIDELYDTIDSIYDMQSTGGPMFETNMRGMLRLLMGSKPPEDFKPTILEFKNCYLYEKFRRWLFWRSDEEITKDFIKELEESRGELSINNMSPYVTSKFNRFTNDTTLMNIIGQEETSVDFEEIMEQGKIFLVKLAKGRFGATVSALLASQLVARFKHAAMKRGEIRPEKRRDFYLYVDECHNLPMSTFTELLSESRKYRMGLVLATQYAAQLQGKRPGDNLLSAIIGNVGCLTIFRLGQEDAKLLEPSLFPHFNMIDIIGLPNWQGYCRLQIRNQAVAPFSFKSIKDEVPYNPKIARQVCELSRQIHGCSVRDIQKKINHRRNIWKNEDE